MSVWKCDTELDGLEPYTKPEMETGATLVSDDEEEEQQKKGIIKSRKKHGLEKGPLNWMSCER